MKIIYFKTLILIISSLLLTNLNASENKVNLLKELFVVMHMEEVHNKATENMLKLQMEQNKLDKEQSIAMYKFYKKYMAFKHLEADIITIYSDVYSIKDIKNMIVFYKTDTGQKTLLKYNELHMAIQKMSINKSQLYSKELNIMIKKEYTKTKNQKNYNLVKENFNTLFELEIYQTKTDNKKESLKQYLYIKKNKIKANQIIKIYGKDLYFNNEINFKILTTNSNTVMKPKLYNGKYIIIKIVNKSKKNNLIQNKKLTLIKENHAVLKFKNVEYILDSYIVMFENPYYISIERKDKGIINHKDAINISIDYIKPRGCTSPLKRLPNLDKNNKEKTKWLIGISC